MWWEKYGSESISVCCAGGLIWSRLSRLSSGWRSKAAAVGNQKDNITFLILIIPPKDGLEEIRLESSLTRRYSQESAQEFIYCLPHMFMLRIQRFNTLAHQLIQFLVQRHDTAQHDALRNRIFIAASQIKAEHFPNTALPRIVYRVVILIR